MKWLNTFCRYIILISQPNPLHFHFFSLTVKCNHFLSDEYNNFVISHFYKYQINFHSIHLSQGNIHFLGVFYPLRYVVHIMMCWVRSGKAKKKEQQISSWCWAFWELQCQMVMILMFFAARKRRWFIEPNKVIILLKFRLL